MKRCAQCGATIPDQTPQCQFCVTAFDVPAPEPTVWLGVGAPNSGMQPDYTLWQTRILIFIGA